MAGSSTVRTRHQSECRLTRYLAKSGQSTPKELLATELPTTRAILLLGLHLQEEKLIIGIDKRNYSVRDLSKDLAQAVMVPWSYANALFKHPVVVSSDGLVNKIRKDWDLGQRISLNNGTKRQIEDFEKRLDRLYDLTK